MNLISGNRAERASKTSDDAGLFAMMNMVMPITIATNAEMTTTGMRVTIADLKTMIAGMMIMATGGIMNNIIANIAAEDNNSLKINLTTRPPR